MRTTAAGQENLLRNLRVRELCYPKGLDGDEDFAGLLSLAQSLGTRLRPVAAWDTLWYDDLELRVLWPQRLRAGKENADSLVLLAQPGQAGRCSRPTWARKALPPWTCPRHGW